MSTPSEKQLAANRRNALRSTGPRTAEGKRRSRMNGLVHGLAAQVVVPEEDRVAFDAAIARWDREMGPANVVERHLARRAAACSVKLERIERTREQTRSDAALKALTDWEKRRQARARRKAQGLAKDPSNTVLDLEGSAFGCDWLIRQWQALDAPLRLGRGWDQKGVLRAQTLLGYPGELPGLDGNREIRRLWILAGVASPTQVTLLPRLKAEESLPTDPAHARAALSRFVAEQVHRLEGLRDESWEEVEGPEGRAIALQAASADPSAEGQLMHRYEVAADRSANAAVRLFLNLRDRRRKEILELAKEARQCSIPRAPVGGGWWCEVDADPAPPGFERIASDPFADPVGPVPPPCSPASSAAVPADGDPAGLPPAVEALPEPVIAPPPRPSEPEAPPEGSGAPRRSEPNPSEKSSGRDGRKSNPGNRLRIQAVRGPSGSDRRTGPTPTPPRPTPGRPDRAG